MFDILSRIRRTGFPGTSASTDASADAKLEPMQRELQKVFGRALCIREVDAGSCNGCELEIQALANPYYNLEGHGVRFVASPRHADLLLVTGPVSVNMEEALRRTYDAMPDPKWVVAVGDCAACGGVFGSGYATHHHVGDLVPVDATVVGCPPTPADILRAILDVVAHSPRRDT